MNYTKTYSDRTEGLFITDQENYIRFSIVVDQANVAGVYDLVTEILRDIDKRVESNCMILSTEIIAALYPTYHEKLEPLLLNPKDAEELERIVRSFKNRNNTIDLLPSLLSLDREAVIELEKETKNHRSSSVRDLIEKVKVIRMFDEEEVIGSYVRQ